MRRIVSILVIALGVCLLSGCKDPQYKEGMEETFQVVQHSRGEGSICFELPGDWQYAVVDDEQGTGFSIEIWPESQTSGKLSVKYCDDGFGVCGTNLKAEKITVGKYEAEKGIYGNARFWDYISLIGAPRTYVVLNEGADSWRQKYKDEAMQILNTMRVANDSIAGTSQDM